MNNNKTDLPKAIVLYHCPLCDYEARRKKTVEKHIMIGVHTLCKIMKEICIVAAIQTLTGFIIRGQRHGDCLLAMSRIKSLTKYEINHAEQGFITSWNRFVSRTEGRKLQDAAGIKSMSDEGYVANTLFSEDLY